MDGDNGSDNCSTCWFNRRNNGCYGRGDVDRDVPEAPPDECVLRGDPIATPPQVTSCANHPQYNHRDGLVVPQISADAHHPYYSLGPTVPIGPVRYYRAEKRDWVVAAKSPDSTYIRSYLVHLVERARAHASYWPEELGRRLVREYWAIWQVGEFREKDAVKALEALLAAPVPSANDKLSSLLSHVRAEQLVWLQGAAREALENIRDPRGRSR